MLVLKPIFEAFMTRVSGLYYKGEFQCFIMEPSWKGNKRNKSCIPRESVYRIKLYDSHRFGRTCIALYDVENRDYICIHPGNYRHDTRGCLLPGVGCYPKYTKILDSIPALDSLVDLIGKDKITHIYTGEM